MSVVAGIDTPRLTQLEYEECKFHKLKNCAESLNDNFDRALKIAYRKFLSADDVVRIKKISENIIAQNQQGRSVNNNLLFIAEKIVYRGIKNDIKRVLKEIPVCRMPSDNALLIVKLNRVLSTLQEIVMFENDRFLLDETADSIYNELKTFLETEHQRFLDAS